MKVNLTKNGMKVITNIAKKLAERDANTTCAFYAYQTKLPSAVKKMRKISIKKYFIYGEVHCVI